LKSNNKAMAGISIKHVLLFMGGMVLALFLEQAIKSEEVVEVTPSVSGRQVNRVEGARLAKIETALAGCRRDLSLCPEDQNQLVTSLDSLERALQAGAWPSFPEAQGRGVEAEKQKERVAPFVKQLRQRQAQSISQTSEEQEDAQVFHEEHPARFKRSKEKAMRVEADEGRGSDACGEGPKDFPYKANDKDVMTVVKQCTDEALRLYPSGKSLPLLFYTSPNDGKGFCEMAKQHAGSRKVDCTLSSLSGIKDGSVGANSYEFVGVPLQIPSNWAPFRSSGVLPIASIIHPAQLLIDQYELGHTFTAAELSEGPNQNHLTKHFSGAEFCPNCVRITGLEMSRAKKMLSRFGVIVMPQYPYESTKLLCALLKWKDCDKLAARAITAAVDRDNSDMGALNENGDSTTRRQRTSKAHAGESLGLGLRVPQRVASEKKLELAFEMGGGDKSDLLSIYSKNNAADLGAYSTV
jgi:hypothetical protein